MISEKILSEIKNKNIHPRCRGYFICKEGALWFFAFVFLLAGGFLFAAILEKMFEKKFEAGIVFAERLIQDVPNFWIIFSIFFVVSATVAYGLTRKAYRHRKRYLLMASAFAMGVLGAILYIFDLGKNACDFLK